MLDDFFKFKENGADYRTEIIAGITTFLAMAYILGVNPSMLAEGGMPANAVFFSTAIASGLACIVMGLVAKFPVGLAPGMGLNALFTYTIILEMGNSWETALAAVFISSIIFFIITISGLREAILNLIPADLKIGIGAGIGFFLAFLGYNIGFLYSKGASSSIFRYDNHCSNRHCIQFFRIRNWKSVNAVNSCTIHICQF